MCRVCKKIATSGAAAESAQTVLVTTDGTTVVKPAMRDYQKLPADMTTFKCLDCDAETTEDKSYYIGPKQHGGWEGFMTKRCSACRKAKRETAENTAANGTRTTTSTAVSLPMESNDEDPQQSSIEEAAAAAAMRAICAHKHSSCSDSNMTAAQIVAQLNK